MRASHASLLPPVADRRAELAERYADWTPRTTAQVLQAAARAHPDRPFLISDERTVTYADVDAWSDRIARGLVASGVRPGEHVALVMANYLEFVAVKYGIAKAGAVTVPINFLNRRDELGYVLRQSDAVLLITMDRFRHLDYMSALDELAPGWETSGGGGALPRLREVFVFATEPAGGRDGAHTLQELEARGDTGDGPLPDADPHALCDVLYTSGTTGSPKGVLLTHDMLTRTAFGSVYVRAFQDGRRLLFSLPLYHVYGYVEGLLAVPYVAGAVVLQRTFDAAATLRAVERHRADDALFVPTMTLDVLDAARAGAYDLSSLTAVFSSGGQSPNRIWQEVLDVLQPDELVTGYGMSETTASTTCTLPEDPAARLYTTNGRMKDVGPAGDPALGGRLTTYKAVHPDTGHDLPAGEIGELLVKGPGVTSGYYAKPEETSQAFDAHGWFRTGDLGTVDADGYLALIGRKKDCYRCGGEQVTPKEIEDVLIAHPAVAQAHVVPLPDERLGEVGVAYVVFKEGLTEGATPLLEHCGQRLARFKVPRHVVAIRPDELPVTPSGRPRKFLLAERARRDLLSP